MIVNFIFEKKTDFCRSAKLQIVNNDENFEIESEIESGVY